MTSEYAHLTTPEAGEAQERGDLLILPIGATEQHGDHLPLGTDTLRAVSMARSISEELGDRAHVLPEIGYGVSPHHSNRAGTISLPPRMLIDMICSLVRSLHGQGWRKLLVITGHGGNAAVLGAVQQEILDSHPDMILAWTQITPLAPRAHSEMVRTEVTGHSGESETAQMLALHPELVRMDRARPGATRLEDLQGRTRLSRDPRISLATTFENYSPHGVLGDPTTATAADGRAIVAEARSRITDYSRQLLDL